MMRIELTGISKGRRGVALPATDLAFGSGEATLAVAETAQRPTVLGLIASGRMRPDAGTLTLDGVEAAREIRRRVALVDAPDVSAPAPNVAVVGVVAEELMFAGLPSDPIAARRWLDGMGLRAFSRLPIADLAPEHRLRILLELAAARPGVDALVLVSPDRHGGDPAHWWALAQDFAARGLAVLVIAGEAAAVVITEVAEAGPASARPERLRPSRVRLRAASADRARARARASAPPTPTTRPRGGTR